MSTHMIVLGDGKYWAGGVSEHFSTWDPKSAYRDSEEAHTNKIARMQRYDKELGVERSVWSNAEVVPAATEL